MKPVNQVMSKTIPNMTLLSKETCRGCQMEISIYEMEMMFGPEKGKTFKAKMGCKCEDLKLAEEALRERAALKVKKMQSIFNEHSLINRELQDATFDNYESKNKSQNKAKRIAGRFVEVFSKDEPINLVFTGAYGVGKSHLAKSISDGVIDKGYSSIFISVPKLLTKFRSTYNKDSKYSEGEVIEALITTDVLILDDIGAENSNDWSWEKVFEIVDSRQGLHTIYTTNFETKDLKNKLGERNFSRIVNRDTTVVEMEGDNYRLGKFAQ